MKLYQCDIPYQNIAIGDKPEHPASFELIASPDAREQRVEHSCAEHLARAIDDLLKVSPVITVKRVS